MDTLVYYSNIAEAQGRLLVFRKIDHPSFQGYGNDSKWECQNELGLPVSQQRLDKLLPRLKGIDSSLLIDLTIYIYIQGEKNNSEAGKLNIVIRLNKP